MSTQSPLRVLIVGGGIAGPVLALFLKQAGIASEIFEAAPSLNLRGVALGITPNGMNVLKDANVADDLRKVSVTTGEAAFLNQHGDVLAVMPPPDPARYGESGIMITRAALGEVLMQRAASEGIPTHYGKRLVGIEDRPGQPVVARFADGSCAEGDCIIGADGIRSQVRQCAMPHGPTPAYTGMMAPGGFSPVLAEGVTARSTERVHFVFGRNGFFGFFNTVTAHGPKTVWWSTFAAPLPTREQMLGESRTALQEKLLTLHETWASPIPELIRSTTEVLNLPIHDVAGLPTWSAGRVLLIGDAAHAVAPHSGQGASMALEDAQVLGRLLRNAEPHQLPALFRRFEACRRPRTDKVIAIGRRMAQRKEAMTPVAYWIQQQMIRIFVPLAGAKGQHSLLNYRAANQPL